MSSLATPSSMFRTRLRTLAATVALGLALTTGCGGAATTGTRPATTAAKAATADGEPQLNVIAEVTADGRLVDDPVADAVEAIGRGDHDGARASLEQLIAGMPADWRPVTRHADRIEVASWSMSELTLQALFASAGGVKTVVWVAPSYSRAYGALAFLAVEDGDLDRAATLLDAGLALEPHHHALLTERALVAGQQKQFDRALDLYTQASEALFATDADRARAWRGRGVILIDLARLDDAEAALKKSLELEPDSKVALGELEYLRQLRAGETQATGANIIKQSPSN